MGPIVWLVGLLCIALAAYFEYAEKDEVPPKRAWTLPQAAAIWVGLAALIAAVVAQHRFGGTSHLAANGASLLGEEDEDDMSVAGGGGGRRRGSSSASARNLLAGY